MTIVASAGSGLDTTVAALSQHAGQELGVTEWQRMTQERVDAFADVTEDHNFVHVDAERAKATPFGGTIAHGYLTLALLGPISQQLLRVTETSTAINYGLDRVRFPAPLQVGARFRGRGELVEVTDVKGGVQAKALFTVEVEGQERPALVAEGLYRYYYA